ncbi:unnamed protein product [Bemisia tabaci]|uniref:Uncharacterized protein n=1 Tax=Bemisia tabaci TaxID=7038 RepID=A0A9P0AA56_BEMTA|nr:unnamed protein product [Bemisia tabaci]
MERRNFAIELTTEPLPPTTAGMNQTHEEYPIMEMTLSPMLDAGGISPVQLAYDWSRVWRLLIMLALCVIGSIGNVYMISSVMIEDHLKKKGAAGYHPLPGGDRGDVPVGAGADHDRAVPADRVPGEAGADEPRLQALDRIHVGLLPDAGQHVLLPHVPHLLVTVRRHGGRHLGAQRLRLPLLQPRLVRPLQVLLQQPPLLRRQPPLPQRLHQPLPLLLLQDHSDFQQTDADRRFSAVRRREGAHHPGLQHVLVHESATRPRHVQAHGQTLPPGLQSTRPEGHLRAVNLPPQH